MAKRKVHKKMNKKIKKTVLGTLSAVLMISALIVAALPVKEAKAETLLISADPDTIIPDYDASSKIYSDKDNNFRVANVDNGVGGVTGVVMYYNIDNYLSTGSLAIPAAIPQSHLKTACLY